MTVTPADLPAGFLDDLFALLAIPSVAAWRAEGDAMERAADWLRARLSRAGLSARLLEGSAGAPPYVYAEGPQVPGRPTLLVYGHYDVQPAKQADGWSSDPFVPVLREGRIYARGATDQKMNLLLPVVALEGLDPAELGCNLKVFFEGEEEILSPHLADTLSRYRDLLACDFCISSDGWQAGPAEGDLRLGLRGFCGVELTLFGATKDLHSGTFGGAAPNPAIALARLLAGLWGEDGRVALPGFYDGIPPLTAAERDTAAADFDETAWRARAGLRQDRPLAVTGADIPLHTGLLPALEIHALEAGNYAGGLRTVIPERASARLSCRLVPGQEPLRIREALANWLRRHLPAGIDMELTPLPGTARPYRIAADHPGQRLAADVLTGVDGQPPRFTYSGGAIPLPGEIEAQLGIKTVVFGFGLPDENMHAADEFCRLSDIRRGLAAWKVLLCRRVELMG